MCSKAAFYVFNGNIDRSIWKWGKSQQCDACVSLLSESLVCQTQLPAQETEHILYRQPWELCPHTCTGWRPPGTRVKQFCFSHPKNDAAGSSARGFDALLPLQVGPKSHLCLSTHSTFPLPEALQCWGHAPSPLWRFPSPKKNPKTTEQTKNSPEK